MKCEDVSYLMDDLFDSRLDAATERALRAHLEACVACRSDYESLAALRQRVAGLPKGIEPERDLWPDIASRIVATKVVRVRFAHRGLMAAAAAVLVVSSIMTAYFMGRHEGISRARSNQATRPAAADVLSASFAEIGVHDYRATRQQLVNVIEARKDELSPATLEVVLTNLRLIDEAMHEIAAALEEDPENELLIRQLVSIYRQQINLLERAAILPSQA